MAAALAARTQKANILGVFDVANNTEAVIESCLLGEAIHFVANASVLGYDVRAAVVVYGTAGTPHIRARDCAVLWATYGSALLEP